MMLEPHDSFVSADRNNSHLREFHVDLEPPPLTTMCINGVRIPRVTSL